MLKVTVAEVQRDVIKQLGIDLNGSVGCGTAVVNFNNHQPVLRVRPGAEPTSIAASTGTGQSTSSHAPRCARWSAPA